MDPIPPTLPFHINKAYGVRGPVTVRPVQPVAPAQSQSLSDAVRVSPGVARLVAGAVPGSVGFEAGTPRPTGSSLPFYRHPADANAAATSVNLGRVIDTNG